jgi:hypothetical protein
MPLLPVFRSALVAQAAFDRAYQGDGDALQPAIVAPVLEDCVARNDGSLDSVVALLRRFASEAAILEARDLCAAMTREADDVENVPAVTIEVDVAEASPPDTPDCDPVDHPDAIPRAA